MHRDASDVVGFSLLERTGRQYELNPIGNVDRRYRLQMSDARDDLESDDFEGEAVEPHSVLPRRQTDGFRKRWGLRAVDRPSVSVPCIDNCCRRAFRRRLILRERVRRR